MGMLFLGDQAAYLRMCTSATKKRAYIANFISISSKFTNIHNVQTNQDSINGKYTYVHKRSSEKSNIKNRRVHIANLLEMPFAKV